LGRLKETTLNLSLLLTGLVAGALVVEAATRLLSLRLLDLSHPDVVFDPEIGWVQREGRTSLRKNEDNEEVAVEGTSLGIRKPSRAYRSQDVDNILVIGDSFTAGTQLPFDDTFPARLEVLLRERLPRVQVINAGVDGYDLAQGYHLARRLWNSFRPRALLVAVYLGNDLIDYVADGFARPPWQPQSPKSWLREHSYCYHVLSGATRKWRKAALTPAPGGGGEWVPKSIPEATRLMPEQVESIRRQFASTDLLPVLKGGAESRRRLGLTQRALKAFAVLASPRCATLVVVLVPTKQQVIPSQRAEWEELHGLSDAQAFAAQTELTHWAAEQGIPCVDATHALSEADRPERLFWRVDLHLSREGQRVVAETLAAPLELSLEAPRPCSAP